MSYNLNSFSNFALASAALARWVRREDSGLRRSVRDDLPKLEKIDPFLEGELCAQSTSFRKNR